MTATAACANGGALVGPRDWLPTDPRDRDWGDLAVKPGCSNLSCSNCGKAVRSWAGWSFTRNPSPADAAALHASAHEPEYAGVVRDSSRRLYACSCTISMANTHRPTQGDWTDDLTGGLPWSCAGHPRPLPGETLHGVTIGAPDAVDQALAAPPLPIDRTRRWHVLVHVAGLLAGTPEGAAMALEESRRLLRTGDPAQVRCAWAFFLHHPTAPGAEACGPAFHATREFLLRTADPVHGDGTLAERAGDTLMCRLRVRDANGVPTDRGAVEALWSLALEVDPLLVHGIAGTDAAWVGARAGEYLGRHPDRLRTLLGALKGRGGTLAPALRGWAGDRPERREELRQRAAQLSPEDRKALELG